MMYALLAVFVVLTPDLSSTSPAPREHAWWVARTAQLQNVVDTQGSNAQVIFVGDSITQGWEGHGANLWEKYFAPLQAINLGISGDRTEHVQWRLENGHLNGLNPDLAVVMIGTNNFGQANTDSEAEVLDGVIAVVETLQSSLPEMHILLLDIFPRGQSFNSMRGSILQVNQALQAKYAGDDSVTFLQIGHIFIENNGVIDHSIMPDSLHLSEKGYQLWVDAILPSMSKHIVAEELLVETHEERETSADLILLFAGFGAMIVCAMLF